QFKQVVRLEPNHLSAHYNLAQALLLLERIEESKKEMATFHRLSLQEDEIKKLQRLIPVQPKNPDLNRKLGEIYFNRNEFKAAVEQFEKVLELNPQEVGTLELLERAKLKIRKIKS
ncbi:tetratricopeptide repeat protein, partial [candidate division KSB1 bacterium]|nr:tetratricopeptide repeat protein [candidate division KSB1 bacterium]